MNDLTKNTLKNHDLRLTGGREDILQVFLEEENALSHSDIENKLGERLDRVTIYRTLKTFLDKGLLHKVLDDEGGTKYALCRGRCSQKTHHHDHVHFKCSKCGNTTCIESVHIPVFSLPMGYERQEVNMLVQGVCPNCQNG